MDPTTPNQPHISQEAARAMLAALRPFAFAAEHPALAEALVAACRPHERADMRAALDAAAAAIAHAEGR